MQIRRFRIGDSPVLRQLRHGANRQTAARDNTAQQIRAWAPEQGDTDARARRH